MYKSNEFSNSGMFRRMDGLHSMKADAVLTKFIEMIKRDLLEEGFEEEEISSFLITRIAQILDTDYEFRVVS
jgi:hypothetical protein